MNAVISKHVLADDMIRKLVNLTENSEQIGTAILNKIGTPKITQNSE